MKCNALEGTKSHVSKIRLSNGYGHCRKSYCSILGSTRDGRGTGPLSGHRYRHCQRHWRIIMAKEANQANQAYQTNKNLVAEIATTSAIMLLGAVAMASLISGARSEEKNN